MYQGDDLMTHSIISLFSIISIIFFMNNMTVYVTPDHDTSMVNSEVIELTSESTTPIEVEVPEGYIPSPEVSDEITLRLSRSDYENDYDDNMDIIWNNGGSSPPLHPVETLLLYGREIYKVPYR